MGDVLCLRGGKVLRSNSLQEQDLFIDRDIISDSSKKYTRAVDVTSCHVLPGIIDVHGDGFEHVLMPRAGVHMDKNHGLIEVDKQLISNGITTAYHGVTVSYEPGQRSLAEALDFVSALDLMRDRLAARHLLHLRAETFAFEHFEAIFERLKTQPSPLLAFNDHLTNLMEGGHMMKKLGKMTARSGLDEVSYKKLINGLWAKRDLVDRYVSELANLSRSLGIKMFAHDEITIQQRQQHRDLGIFVSEFPMTEDVAQNAIDHCEHTVMGAPNLLRGKSHNGAISARDMVRQKRCTIIASDYYYPAPLRSIYLMDQLGIMPLEQGWSLVSQNPAEASGLADLGQLEPGFLADILVVEPRDEGPQLRYVFRNGQLVYQAPSHNFFGLA